MNEKPLGIKAYGHIAHLPGSRMGPGDHKCHEGQARICTEKARDKHDRIIVQEKLDGACVAVAKIGSAIWPLGRAGYHAYSSRYEQHRLFARWVMQDNLEWFYNLLNDGERIVGEWLAQAHGTRYDLLHGPFVAFDIMRGHERLSYYEFMDRVNGYLPTPWTFHEGGPLSIKDALETIGVHGLHGALDPVEGAVWRVERKGKVDFLAKYVRPDKVDGCYLPEVSGTEAVWNWPGKAESSAG